MADQANRPHRKSKEKKQQAPGSRNPKAYAFANPGRLQRQAARSHDVKEKRLHVPLIDRVPEEAPPLVVAVVGPPQVGKTTLIKSLIRRYTKQTVSAPTGPLTVVTSKRRRLTFMECPADSLAAMIDVAKIVDIVLLMIDGKYGFEMETMEFLNVLAASGMPGNVFGILTHLDLFKKQDALRAQKTRLKHRFWSELYHGAKLFYLSGIVNGRYPDREIHNISRFLAVMKLPRPLIWRNTHPYCLADRFLDITPPTEVEADPKCDRSIALYGYLRGTNFPAEGARVHVPGLGDLNVSEIEALSDPCPTPYLDQAIQKATGKAPRRRLGERQKVLFAPMSDVGGVLVDKDAVYVDVKTSTFDRDGGKGDRGLGEQLMIGLQGERRLLGEGDEDVRLFGESIKTSLNGRSEDRNRRPAQGADRAELLDEVMDAYEDEAYVSGDAEELEDGSEDSAADDIDATDDFDQETNVDGFGDAEASTHDIVFADSDSEIGSLSSANEEDYESDSLGEGDGSDEDGTLNWKENLAEKAKSLLGNKTFERTSDLARLMYDETLTPSEAVRKWKGPKSAGEDDADVEESNDFFRQKKTNTAGTDAEDRMIPVYDYDSLEQKFSDQEALDTLRQRFSSARLSKSSSGGPGEDEDDIASDDEEDSDADEGDGVFEDLEKANGSSNHETPNLEDEREKNARRKEELKLRFEEEDKEGFANDKTNGRNNQHAQEEEFGEDEWYDAQKAKMQTQLAINRAEFDAMDDLSRIRVEGYKAGTYARILLEQVPYEFATFFDPRRPIIIGGLSATEERFGFVQVRIKRHRWHKKILKTNDPLIFSLGWRRFQTLPIYSIHENRMRHRMLKYTPEHMHCIGTFYGPLIAPNTGFSCVQSLSNSNAGFRVAATGTVLNVEESVEIVKKLKLKGYPHKIYKNTAIIKDMLSSELEIMKFKSGNLRTVSGIRGMIKGRAGKQYPPGYVRAGFEDKVLMSDIVYLSTWRQVKPKEFYIPVTNLLLPSKQQADEDDTDWKGMRLTGEVRREQGLATPSDKNSAYRPIERAARHFNPLRVPRKLAADLPFKSQIAQTKPQKNATYLQKRAVVVGGEEKRARDLMQKLSTLRNEKVALRRAAQEKRREPYRKRVAENLEKKAEREKREKQEFWRREGKKRKTDDGDGGSAKRFKR